MRIRPIITPTNDQATLSLLMSLLLLVLIFHTPLISLIAGASNITQGELQTSYQHSLNLISQAKFVSDLTVGLFWVGIGLAGYCLVLTVANFVIVLRNEVVVDTTFTNVGKFSQRLRLPLWRLVLTVALALLLLMSFGLLLPFWEELAGHLLIFGYTAGYLADLLVAIVGLAVNIYVVWMLALTIKNLDAVLQ